MKSTDDLIENNQNLRTELLDEIGRAQFPDTDTLAVVKRVIERLLVMDWAPEKQQTMQQLLQQNDTHLLLSLAGLIGKQAKIGVSKAEKLKLEGIRRFRSLLEHSGGVETMGQVKARLSRSDDTIRKRVANKQMLAIPQGRQQVYPVWQFDGPGMLAHFDTVMQLLESDAPIDQTRFFLTPSADLDNLTPIEALKQSDNYLERIKLKALQFQEQGAK